MRPTVSTIKGGQEKKDNFDCITGEKWPLHKDKNKRYIYLHVDPS